MLRRLYDWTLQKAATPGAAYWLAIVSFIESSFFFIPAEVFLVAMALAKPAHAYRYALIATVFSTLGGFTGYYLGYYAYEALAKPILESYGRLEMAEQLRTSADQHFMFLINVGSGLAHLPPIKVASILSGVVHLNLLLFTIPCFMSRALRFFLMAWGLARYGDSIRDFVERRLPVVAGGILGFIGIVYLTVRYAL